MSFGKAQKQKRNLDAKLAKLKVVQEEKQKQFVKDKELIASMDDDILYSLYQDGKPFLHGMRLTGRIWKEMFANYSK